MMFVAMTDSCSLLFADAEVAEDGGEDIGGGDFAGNFAEVVHALAYILTHEVAANAGLQSVDGTRNGFSGFRKSCVVAGVGHYHLVGIVVGEGCGM